MSEAINRRRALTVVAAIPAVAVWQVVRQSALLIAFIHLLMRDFPMSHLISAINRMLTSLPNAEAPERVREARAPCQRTSLPESGTVVSESCSCPNA